MTHFPVQLPFRGYSEQTQYSVVPEGMTPSCLNVMPIDVFNNRTRISTRNGTRKWTIANGSDLDNIQFIGSYRVYVSGVLTEFIIIVRNGLVYYGNPNTETATMTLAAGQASEKLITTGFVEGVQFGNHFYFVDGTNYAIAFLTDMGGTGVQKWGSTSPSRSGPYHTDPVSGSADGTRATAICRWGARLVIAGFKANPNLWFACKPDNPYPNAGTDGWDPNDWIGAIGGASGSNYGTLGDPIIALIPFGEAGLLFGCSNSFEYLTADPIFADQQTAMVTLTKSIGIAGRRAWCFGQEKSVYVLAKDGLYFLTPNDFNFNRGNRISAGRLDSFFLRLDFGSTAVGGSSLLAGGTLRSVGAGGGASTTILTDTGDISTTAVNPSVPSTNTVANFTGVASGDIWPVLEWDPDREGVWMFLSVSGAPEQSLHLYYDAKTDSFWPQRLYDPKCSGPSSALYIGESRTNKGRLFLGGEDAIVTMERSFAVGIDGFKLNMTDAEQEAQWIRNSLTVGPIIAPLPQRLLLNEVRVDLADDQYEVPSDFNDLSQAPVLTVSSGDTAQSAIGLMSDNLFVTGIRALVIDCEDASPPASPIVYDGGDAALAGGQANRIDGRYATPPTGTYVKSDPFSSGTSVVYNGPSEYLMLYDSGVWKIKWATTETEYIKDDADISPNGLMTDQINIPISANKDGVQVSGASFSEAVVTEIGNLVSGRNEAIKARIRAEAMYLTIASDGRPWSVERISVQGTQVGKSRGAAT